MLSASLCMHACMYVCMYVCVYIHYIVTCMSGSRWGFGLEVGFIDHFNTRLVTTFNYSASAYFHILQIITAHAKSFHEL
jgi:hypothetical protein